MADDPVLRAERAHLDLAEQCLAEMRLVASGIADYSGDPFASESLGRARAERIRALAADGDAPAFFGRTDQQSRDSTETFHIGRRHIRDHHGDPVVIDWRAPIARAFYQASAATPMGVQLRRRFGFHRGQLRSYEDERLDLGETLGLKSELLRKEIERPRVGPMRDIVATIQPDQDVLVRADLDTSLCIQGAPGTGKTAVGLHRAAYLLYTYPERLRRSGVLVVGPNETFLHYIGEVLPALGERGIEQSTIESLVSSVPVRATEPAEIAMLKGDARLADVMRRAVFSQVRRPTEDLVIVDGTRRYRVPERRVRRYVDDARRSGIRWSIARERLRQQLAEDVRRQREDAGGAPSDAETARLARSRAVRNFVDEVWPPLDAATLLGRLYSDEEFLRRCADSILTGEERALLHWLRIPRSPRSARWTFADAVLIDELIGLIEGIATYVHVVVDEAQDLSPMQCRAVGRRCPLGSLTVLGDLAQATTPWAATSWEASLQHLGHAGAELRELTAGYRVPADVLRIANRLLPHIAPQVPAATSGRFGEAAVRFEPVAHLVGVVREVAEIEGSVGVIVPDEMAVAVLAELRAAGLPAEPVTADADLQITVVPASVAKGLEFDSVVLLEPEHIVSADVDRAVGLRRLYITLTRAVSRLVIVHDEPLPAEVAA